MTLHWATAMIDGEYVQVGWDLYRSYVWLASHLFVVAADFDTLSDISCMHCASG
jgi:hypothetical protein